MKSVEFMTAEQKDRVLKAFTRFLKGGCQWSQFTKALYHHLMQNCSFIAHFDRSGFYHVYFATSEGTADFLQQFLTGGSVEYGGADYWLKGDYADINKAMCEVVQEYAPALLEKGQETAKARDLELAASLIAKWE